MFYRLHLLIEHSEDWSMLCKEFDVSAKPLLYFLANINGSYVRAELTKISCNHDECKDGYYLDQFVYKVKKNKEVYGVVYFNREDRHFNKIRYILTLEDYSSSIRKLINDRLGFFISTKGHKNLEEFTVLFPFGRRTEFEELRDQLDEMGTVHLFDVTKVSDTVLPTYPRLTQRETEVMQTAWSSGYFNYPKNINLEEMARDMSIKRSTLDYHLREGVKKSIQFLIDTGMYEWQ